jgi:L-alanine-DL-glutamate epimerase and related enzymes of enolase superfamily
VTESDRYPAASALAHVENVDVACYTVPTPTPEADGTAQWNATTVVVVTIESADQAGVGWSYTETAAGSLVSGVLAPVLLGLRVWDIPSAARAMSVATRNTGRSGIASAAISAVDIALWDLKARTLGVSMADLFGRARAAIPVYGSGGFVSDDHDTLERELRGWLAEGIRAVKIKIGEDFGGAERRDLRRVGFAREVIGTDTGLFVDANGGYSPGQARRVERALREHGVSWFEEPVSSAAPAQLAAVRRAATVDVAAGE